MLGTLHIKLSLISLISNISNIHTSTLQSRNYCPLFFIWGNRLRELNSLQKGAQRGSAREKCYREADTSIKSHSKIEHLSWFQQPSVFTSGSNSYLFIYLLKTVNISTVCFRLPTCSTKRWAAITYATFWGACDTVTGWSWRHKEADVIKIIITEPVLGVHLLHFCWIVGF